MTELGYSFAVLCKIETSAALLPNFIMSISLIKAGSDDYCAHGPVSVLVGKAVDLLLSSYKVIIWLSQQLNIIYYILTTSVQCDRIHITGLIHGE